MEQIKDKLTFYGSAIVILGMAMSWATSAYFGSKSGFDIIMLIGEKYRLLSLVGPACLALLIYQSLTERFSNTIALILKAIPFLYVAALGVVISEEPGFGDVASFSFGFYFSLLGTLVLLYTISQDEMVKFLIKKFKDQNNNQNSIENK